MKIITTILALLLPILAMAAESTTDHLTLTAEPLQPGGEEVEVTVSLDGSRLYTGYEMDLTLPEGVDLCYYDGEPDVTMYMKDDCIYPYTDKRGQKIFTHGITATYGDIAPRTVRVVCVSSSNENFRYTSGKLLTLYLRASTYAKPGDVALALSNCKLATFDAETMTVTGYVPEQTFVGGLTVGTSATASLAVSPTVNWGTLMLPFPSALPDGVQAYSCSSHDSESLILSPVSSLQAFTPYIIYSASGYEGNLSGTVCAADYPTEGILTSGYLRASVALQTLSSGYVMQKQGIAAQFHRVAADKPITIKPGKCWVELPSSLASKGFLGVLVDGPNCIVPHAADALGSSSTLHTLDGKPLQQMRKGGIYITKGKKYTR